MRLVLNNFKQHEDLSIEIPTFGLVRIAGPSGVGKSTIFEAIDFAINGEGDDLVSWGKKSGSVTLEINDMVITRCKRPDSLILLYKDELFRESEAQERIYATFGINAEEFEAAAYIKQGHIGSILSLKPADQLRFIQRLSDSTVDPDAFKKFLVAYQKSSEQKLASLQKDRLSKQELLHKISNDISSLVALEQPVKPEPLSLPSLAEINSRIAAAQLQKITQNKILQAVRSQQSAIKDMSSIELATENEKNTVNELQSDLGALHGKILGITINTQEVSRAEKSIELAKLIAQAREIVKKVRDELQCLDNTSILAGLNNKKTELNEELQTKNQLISQYKQQLTELNKTIDPQRCPQCGEGLMVSAGVIVRHLNPRPDDFEAKIGGLNKAITEAQKECITISDTLSKVSVFISEISILQKNIEELKIALGGAPMPNEEAKFFLENQKKAATEKSIIEASISDKTTKLKQSLNKIQLLEQRFQNLTIDSTLPSESDALASLHSVEITIAELNSAAMRWGAYNTEMSSYNNLLQQYNANQDMLTRSKVLQESVAQEVAVISGDILNESNNLIKTTQLIDMTEKAAVESIEGILHMINTSAEKYLDAMFPEGISIQLLNFKTTQKGDERAKIGVDISHKGQKVKSLKSFSGGQRSRINLAFQLGLSNLYNCPFLLIDEGLTGVDTESHRECLEFLKEFSQQKLILIIEHHADRSLFDEEIVL